MVQNNERLFEDAREYRSKRADILAAPMTWESKMRKLRGLQREFHKRLDERRKGEEQSA